MSDSWFWPRHMADLYPHECGNHGWDGPCRKPCRVDDRYRTAGGDVLFLCANHRSPKRRPTNAMVNRTERVAVEWIGGEA